jgi:hypothetical protein
MKITRVFQGCACGKRFKTREKLKKTLKSIKETALGEILLLNLSLFIFLAIRRSNPSICATVRYAGVSKTLKIDRTGISTFASRRLDSLQENEAEEAARYPARSVVFSPPPPEVPTPGCHPPGLPWNYCASQPSVPVPPLNAVDPTSPIEGGIYYQPRPSPVARYQYMLAELEVRQHALRAMQSARHGAENAPRHDA